MYLERGQLRLLAALARFNGLAPAAEHLGLSASAASRRLDEAERRLGVALTETHGKRRLLNAAGRHLAASVDTLEIELQRAELTSRWLASGMRARVRVGVGFFDCPGWLGALLRECGEAEIVRLPTGGEFAALLANEADLVLDASTETPSGFDTRQLGEDTLVGVLPSAAKLARAGRPLCAADFAATSYLCSGYAPRPGYELSRFFLGAGTSPSRLVRVESLAILLQLVAAGRGFSIQPRAAVEAVDGVTLVPLEVDIHVRWLAAVKDGAMPAVLELRDAFAQSWRRVHG